MVEKLTPRLVQEEIDRACAATGATANDVIFGRLKAETSKKTRKARRIAIAEIINRSDASRLAVAKAWGCDTDFIEPYWPTHDAVSEMTRERFDEMLAEAVEQSGITAETILSFSCLGTASQVRFQFIEQLIEKGFATYAELAEFFNVSTLQIQGILTRRGLSRDKIIINAMARRSADDRRAWSNLGN